MWSSSGLGLSILTTYIDIVLLILPIQPTHPPSFLSLLRFICLTYLLALHFLVSSSGFSSAFIVVPPCFLSISSSWFHKIISGQTRSLIFGILVGCSSLFLGANRIDFVFLAVLLTAANDLSPTLRLPLRPEQRNLLKGFFNYLREVSFASQFLACWGPGDMVVGLLAAIGALSGA